MLYISLIASAVLLLLVNWLARRAEDPGRLVAACGLSFVVGPILLTCVLPAVALQALLICVATFGWREARLSRRAFLPLSCGATAVAYALAGLIVLNAERTYARLRARYPLESMEARLPAPRPAPEGPRLRPETRDVLVLFEQRFPETAGAFRNYQLEALHDRAVSLFINSPGFGVARMLRPSESGLALNSRREPAPPQPGTRSRSTWSPGEWKRTPVDDDVPLRVMLEDSIVDFANPWGFGYFKDRRHVAGFQSHRFGGVPRPTSRWKVGTLELVSLLLHDEPGVYTSARLPQMDRLQGVPTRPLDRFERFGLQALEDGEPLVAAEVDDGLRMLGAVRAIKQCVACHGVERGTLLGAFSYTLRPEEPEPDEEPDQE